MAKRIIVVFGLSVVAGQRRLAAFSRRLGKDPDVELTILRSKEEFTPQLVRDALAENASGFVISFRQPAGETCDALTLLASSKVPVVTHFHCPELDARTHDVVTIANDNRDIGRQAAAHLLATKRCASYAYLHNPLRSQWSLDRHAGFAGELAARNRTCAELDAAEELLGLPKPVGVLANNDDTARAVLSFCRANGLSVPDDILLVGVDNDEAVCCHSIPKITSVEPDFEQEGVLAADQMLAFLGRSPRARPQARRDIAVPPHRLVARASTEKPDDGDSLARRTLAFVKENALSDITIDTIAKRLHASRRLIDLRFRECFATSIRETIISLKLAEVRRLLEETDLPVEEIPSRCGYRSLSHLRTLFQRQFGMTMGECRSRRDSSEALA